MPLPILSEIYSPGWSLPLWIFLNPWLILFAFGILCQLWGLGFQLFLIEYYEYFIEYYACVCVSPPCSFWVIFWERMHNSAFTPLYLIQKLESAFCNLLQCYSFKDDHKFFDILPTERWSLISFPFESGLALVSHWEKLTCNRMWWKQHCVTPEVSQRGHAASALFAGTLALGALSHHVRKLTAWGCHAVRKPKPHRKAKWKNCVDNSSWAQPLSHPSPSTRRWWRRLCFIPASSHLGHPQLLKSFQLRHLDVAKQSQVILPIFCLDSLPTEALSITKWLMSYATNLEEVYYAAIGNQNAWWYFCTIKFENCCLG